MDSNRCRIRSRSRSKRDREVNPAALKHTHIHTYIYTNTYNEKDTTPIWNYTLLTFIYSIEQILSLFITIIIYCISRRRKKGSCNWSILGVESERI